MSRAQPTTFKELFRFYYDFVKPLYSEVQVQKALPQEALFELNAAFDHLSRYWYYGEPEEKVVAKAYSHLKRLCLDIFKLRLKEVRKQFEELRATATSVIDQGEFDIKLARLFQNIKEGAKQE